MGGGVALRDRLATPADGCRANGVWDRAGAKGFGAGRGPAVGTGLCLTQKTPLSGGGVGGPQPGLGARLPHAGVVEASRSTYGGRSAVYHRDCSRGGVALLRDRFPGFGFKSELWWVGPGPLPPPGVKKKPGWGCKPGRGPRGGPSAPRTPP